MSEKHIYFFGEGKAEGTGQMKDVLGGKGAGLAEMTNLGINVPPGFTITTRVCTLFYENGGKVPESLVEDQKKNLQRLEKVLSKKLGDPENPLLVSVRSGAKFSMPGMMDTILNLGLNDRTVEGLAKLTDDRRFALDSYRRFIQMFGNVVLNIAKEKFEKQLSAVKQEKNVKLDTELKADDWNEVIRRFKEVVRQETGKDFPQDPQVQLDMSRDAVFQSWNNDRARYYRKQNKIPDDLGTAVNVQAMVFGNMGDKSATGVGFTRNPSTGEAHFYGEYLTNAQGEDVVAGIRTPKTITGLKDEMSAAYEQLVDITSRLEKHYRDVQDFEFTIENERLFMLQTRTGKRTAAAAVKIVVDMVNEGLITKEEAVLRIDPAQLDQLLHPIIDPSQKVDVAATGLPASPGAATGVIAFTADEAVEVVERDKLPVILVREETVPDDIHGMDVAKGILTARGGMTSHAAVVARGMGKPCVAGCESLHIDEQNRTLRIGDKIVKDGEYVTIDGGMGHVIVGKVKLQDPELSGEFGILMSWADEFRKLRVRANADIPRDAQVARRFGAQGIGLCRSEHMFFDPERVPVIQEMILAHDAEERKPALQKIKEWQRSDFIGLFREMNGFPVTVRLLDPPLHEFLPRREELMLDIAQLKSQSRLDSEKKKELVRKEALLKRVSELHEMNPMLGHRGCRLGLTYPDISEMQIEAICEAAAEVQKDGVRCTPEIMIPLVGIAEEFRLAKKQVDEIAERVFTKLGIRVLYLTGTMIELPRAALIADEIAREAEFFSFGTNDLTQTTYGFSRDDIGKFLPKYVEMKILQKDPFVTIDRKGVGQLMKTAVEKGRSARGDLKLGICGEHGGDPESVEFCHSLKLNYVSCSPFRVPIARLAAAQAALKEKGAGDLSKAQL
ncbi:pyruvate, phosphate dikinase [bacterium]|nr:pyruvate, phosphate dikinase [bacterium]